MLLKFFIEYLKNNFEECNIIYIDFITIRRNEKLYIQVAGVISNEIMFKREVDSLLKVNVAYPKIIIARTKHDEYTFEVVKGLYLLMGN